MEEVSWSEVLLLPSEVAESFGLVFLTALSSTFPLETENNIPRPSSIPAGPINKAMSIKKIALSRTINRATYFRVILVEEQLKLRSKLRERILVPKRPRTVPCP